MSSFYHDYVEWGAKRAATLAGDQKLAFLRDFVEPLDIGFQKLEEMEKTFPGGKGLLLAMAIWNWLKSNRDPLAGARASVKRTRAKWGE